MQPWRAPQISSRANSLVLDSARYPLVGKQAKWRFAVCQENWSGPPSAVELCLSPSQYFRAMADPSIRESQLSARPGMAAGGFQFGLEEIADLAK